MNKSSGKRQTASDSEMQVISFKVAKNLYEALTEIGKDHTDDAGKVLGAAGMARKIVREHLAKMKK